MAVSLARVLAELQDLAPLRFAAEWDNVGLLVEPMRRPRQVTGILLAVDCTPPVVEEALRRRCELIVSYHPPIFRGLKALRGSEARTGALLGAAAGGVTVYSPHTALDAVPGGVADWLAEPFGEAESEPLLAARDAPPGTGQGRVLRLRKGASLAALVRRIKVHLGLRTLQVARGLDRDPRIATVALVPGSGGDLIVPRALAGGIDLVLTGELRHHEVLSLVERGCEVVLAGHSESERGYLPRLRARLRGRLGPGPRVDLARSDRAPLRAV